MSAGLQFRTQATLDAGPVTPGGQSRKKAFADDGFWSGLATVDTGGQWASWHHHAGYDSIFMIKTGALMYHDGATDTEVVMETGDWSFIPPGAVHRAKTLSENPCEYVFFRLGHGESVVNLDSYTPGHGGEQKVWFKKADELEVGPVTPGGQSRKKAFADDGFWSGLATVDTGGQWASWHHHAGYDSIFMIKTGALMYHDGATDTEVVMETGDWSFIPPGAVHRAKTLSEKPCEYVYFRRGHGESVLNVPDYTPEGGTDDQRS